jgi:hypothetical protein
MLCNAMEYMGLTFEPNCNGMKTFSLFACNKFEIIYVKDLYMHMHLHNKIAWTVYLCAAD